MSCAARSARTPSSPTTPAATGIAPSAKARRQRNGWPSARPSCCRCRTSTSCSRLPARIADIAYQNKAVIYDLLFKASAETLITIAADPEHLGARIGILSVLHTWGSALTHHPHVHMIVPGGGFSLDGKQLGHVPAALLPPGARAVAIVPPTVPAEARRRTCGRRAAVLRRARRTHRAQGLRRLSGAAAQQRMGGLQQAPLRRAQGSVALSRALHSPRRHLKPPLDRSRRQRASPSSGRTTASKAPSATR